MMARKGNSEWERRIMKPKGMVMLRVISIMMVVFGTIGAVGLIIAATGITYLALVGLPGTWGGAGDYVMPIVDCVAFLTTGTVGIRFCADTRKANLCLALGIACAVVSVIGDFVDWIPGTAFPVDSLIWGLILPVLYIVGALRNRVS